MLEGLAFLAFGFLAGLAYLAYHQERELIAYGLGLLGIASALWGIQLLVGKASEAAALMTIVGILRYIALGAGLSFLAFVGTIEGRERYLQFCAKREQELEALRAGLRLEARKDAQPARSNASR
jgi:hypothetical protein